MRLGIAITRFGWPGGAPAIRPALDRIATQVDASGADSLWFMDHLFQIPLYGAADDPLPDAYTLLPYVAARTTRVQLGTMVTCGLFRPPALLIKMVTTLDLLSDGRARLGIGAGGYERELYGLGFELPPLRDRFGRLAETLRLAHQMWAGDRTPFHGEYVRVPEPINEPNVARRPPILVGGGGERRTLALVARYADACNFFEPLGGDTIRHKFAVLREHCERVGRPFEEIDRTTYGELLLRTPEHPEGDSVDQVVDRFGALAELGVDEAVVGLNNPLDASVHELLGEVVRQTRPLVPKGR